jgi:hypothetical protein
MQNFHKIYGRVNRLTPWWSTLREIGNSSLVKMTILIPLAGYLIIFNQRVVELLTLSGELAGLRTPQELPTRLLLMYFGLCLVAIGSAIYNWRCPSIVKRYSSAAEYVNNELDHTPDFTLFDIDHELRKRRYRVEEREAFRPNDLNKSILTLYYGFLNERHVWARAAAMAAFATGVALLTFPSLRIFWSVAALLTKRLTS